MKRYKFICALLLLILVAGVSLPCNAESKQIYFHNYRPVVAGWGNRLSFNNILYLTKTPAKEARKLLKKIGYKPVNNNWLLWEEYYQHSQIYAINFFDDPKRAGFKSIIIHYQPEMRIIADELLAAGYDETRVVPRKGARWTKVYQKKGMPTYSISLLLTEGKDEFTNDFSYDESYYCLICEKQ